MFLQRIRVPDFRVLKNIDISFEKEFIPTIFPLGSLNGGGKSTLLQLIFVLLHCSTHPDRTVFLQNLLEGFRIEQDSDKRVLAIIDIWDGNQSIELEFFTCKEAFIKNLLTTQNATIYNPETFTILVNEELERTEKELLKLQIEAEKLETVLNQFYEMREIETETDKDRYLQGIIRSLQSDEVLNNIFTIVYSLRRFTSNNQIFERELNRRIKSISEKLEETKLNLKKVSLRFDELEIFAKVFIQSLEQNNIIYTCDIPSKSHNGQTNQGILLCHISDLHINEAKSFMKNLSNKVFLAAPISQIFLFLSSNSKKSLFKSQNEKDYYLELKQEKTKLPGFFTYDFMATDVLIKSFTQARDQDFSEAVETGEYGDSYKALLNDLNSVLINKKINVNKDLTGINFKKDDDIELYPEDLSHGELKRLCIYMWIKYNKIENAIVLMDEIEIAFHPDWQYQIIRDLAEWSPTNQYILATHSYDLCEAVTPAHVKELPPKLINQKKSSNSEI